MRNYKFLYILLAIITISSCASTIRTEIYDENYRNEFDKENIYILKNPYSVKHLNILLPPPYYIENYNDSPMWFKYVDKFDDIDNKIAKELLKYDYNSKMINDISEIKEKHAIVIFSQDVWQWDLVNYMHILKVNISYKHNQQLDLIAQIGSEGNSAGIHNFPSPDSEIPRIIKEVLLID